ncbi:hypothetical protein ACC739_38265, partial [Rhizobium ruizarguesonis]
TAADNDDMMIAHDLPLCSISLKANVAFAAMVATAVSAYLPFIPVGGTDSIGIAHGYRHSIFQFFHRTL